MITPGLWPTNRYSQGIQCVGPSVTFSPFVTDSHSFALPRETVTKTPIYDEDTGQIKYYSEIPRFEKENYSFNYGASLQFNIPLGKGIDLCHQAVKTNIKNQEMLFKKTSLEVALFVLKVCAEQARLGATFKPGTQFAVTCQDVQVNVPPGQVKPHVHQIKSSSSSVPSSSQK